MGYTTDFSGEWKLDRPLDPNHLAYLKAFNSIRHMRRDVVKTGTFADPIRDAVRLPLGIEAMYYVGDEGGESYGSKTEARDKYGILDYNTPPGSPHYDKVTDIAVQIPGLWCGWMPNEDGTEIVWDEGEKFYDYEEWIQFLILHFLKPWGYVLNGTVHWSGEESGDMGKMRIKNNVYKSAVAKITFDYEDGEE